MGDPHHYEKAARYARAAWLRKSAPGAEKLGISYPGVPVFIFDGRILRAHSGEFFPRVRLLGFESHRGSALFNAFAVDRQVKTRKFFVLRDAQTHGLLDHKEDDEAHNAAVD